MEWNLSAHFDYSCRLLGTIIRLLLQSKVVICTMHLSHFTLLLWHPGSRFSRRITAICNGLSASKLAPFAHVLAKQIGAFCQMTHMTTNKGRVSSCCFFSPLDRTATDVLVKPCELKACSWKSRLPCKQLPYRNHA